MAKKAHVADDSTSNTTEKAPAAEEFLFKRSNTRVCITHENDDGTVDVQEPKSQATTGPSKTPIPPRYWGAVDKADLEPVDSE